MRQNPVAESLRRFTGGTHKPLNALLAFEPGELALGETAGVAFDEGFEIAQAFGSPRRGSLRSQ